MARPLIPIDPDQVKKLAAIQCSLEEMASILNCSADTLGRRFADVIKEGRATGRSSLKRKQYEVAMGGNVGMLIWLGKQYLDQSEKQEVKQQTEHSMSEKVKALADQLIQIKALE